ncbi:uncharacterized protein C8Q71DRAFT_341054 [Rhodofomes roseus]|uniref:Nas2 N-terminal domain-containing protein n=1 Tax=Rhodofomes roseus TaxID=34475 RepID=A0ABQ8KS50_9APHY|nr:uncharacterized protein C8Q71DRAFT_341054 [Rhodofomes roseus]KAH9841630.1 hypothetical protein C8Q71DRAFT_341054 [Rhodofomes roseus]
MGMMIPSRDRDTPADRVRSLMTQKENIEAELDAQVSILKANSSTLNSPLVDADGFPRADIDIWAVRHARVRIIELRNDLDALRDTIATALQVVFDPATSAKSEPLAPQENAGSSDGPLVPFATVNGVAPGSPAAAAGLLREDLVLSFGPLTRASFPSSLSLQPLAEFVSTRENRQIAIKVLRGSGETIDLSFTPRSGWGGRGLLGCHIVPYNGS